MLARREAAAQNKALHMTLMARSWNVCQIQDLY
jgi:hypothetical protein